MTLFRLHQRAPRITERMGFILFPRVNVVNEKLINMNCRYLMCTATNHSGTTPLSHYFSCGRNSVAQKCNASPAVSTLTLHVPSHRWSSSTSKRDTPLTDEEILGLDTPKMNDDHDVGGPQVLLFQRGTSRNRIARSGLAVSSFHTLYWIWYGLDFVPAVNASPMADLHIDPLIPVVGTLVAAVIQAVFIIYPTRLIDSIYWLPSSSTLRVTPLMPGTMTPRTSKSQRIPVGELVMDASSPETKTILELDGHLGSFRGHLAVGREQNGGLPYLLDIRQHDEVVEPDLLLQALLHPQSLRGRKGSRRKRKGNKSHRGNNSSSSASNHHQDHRGSKRKNQKRRR